MKFRIDRFLIHSVYIVPIVVGACIWCGNRPLTYGPGAVAPRAPIQRPAEGTGAFEYRNYAIKPLARFGGTARVLSRKNYSLGRAAKLCPVDLALGWGPMSDERVLDKVSICQFDRYYVWSVKELSIPRVEIERNSANMHMIPATPEIKKLLRTLKKGNLVEFKGYLVEVAAPDGWRWRSSLSRSDTGSGACEVVWVEELNVL
jgi:hypothetical protein